MPVWSATFLSEQGDLSAVERFAQFHADADEPLQGRYYSALLPAQPPGPGQQLAFEVDLDRCSGCKACVAACHNLNGLDEGESWRDVGLVIGGMPELPVLQHVTSACHHCLDPACLNACPVDAYEKDPHTGIVRHLDDQCIGCQYCTLACPYDAPKYNAAKGIVRKCDMCRDRLAVGEAPACVQACPHEAIRIRVVDNAEVIARAEAGGFLPATPDPCYTLPTTHFRTSHLMGPGDMQPVDDHHLEPEHAHWPLIAMLVLTQLSVGGFAAELGGLAAGLTGGFGAVLQTMLVSGLRLGGAGGKRPSPGPAALCLSSLIGMRHSWLSREVLAFGLFVTLATVYVALVVLSPGWFAAAWGVRAALLGLVVATGSAGVACSVLVYHVVRRPYWRATYGGVKFAGTAVVLGLATALAALGIAVAESSGHARWLGVMVAAHGGRPVPDRRLVRQALVRGEARPRLRQVGTGRIAEDGPASWWSSPAAGTDYGASLGSWEASSCRRRSSWERRRRIQVRRRRPRFLPWRPRSPARWSSGTSSSPRWSGRRCQEG